MTRTNFIHIAIGLTAAALGVLSLVFRWPAAIDVTLIAAANVFVLLALTEVSLRAGPRPEQTVLVPLPDRGLALPQVILLLTTVVASFGNLYVHTGAVRHLVPDKADSTDAAGKFRPTAEPEYLTDPGEAFYFSLVTVTTLGYGDHVPASPAARWLVVWELLTGSLMLLLAVPLVLTRLTTFQ